MKRNHEQEGPYLGIEIGVMHFMLLTDSLELVDQDEPGIYVCFMRRRFFSLRSGFKVPD